MSSIYLMFTFSVAISTQSILWIDHTSYNCDVLSSAFDVKYELTLSECKEYCLSLNADTEGKCRGVSWYQYLKQDVNNDPMRCYLLDTFCDLQPFSVSPTITSFWTQDTKERSECIDYPSLWTDKYSDDCEYYSFSGVCQTAPESWILEHTDPVYNLNAFESCCDCGGSMFAFQADRDTLFIEPLWKPSTVNDITRNMICQSYHENTNIAVHLTSKWDMNSFLGICDYFMQKVQDKYASIYAVSSNTNEDVQSEHYQTLQEFDCTSSSIFTTFYLCDQFDFVNYPYVIDLSSQAVYLNAYFVDITDAMQNIQGTKIYKSECKMSTMLQDNANSDMMATLVCQYKTASPTDYPSPNPTKPPQSGPTSKPTPRPTPLPVPPPTHKPTRSPTPSPSVRPSASPTLRPTQRPTRPPTPRPSPQPTPSPTRKPTGPPTRAPTPSPTPSPTFSPIKDAVQKCSSEGHIVDYFSYGMVGVYNYKLYIFKGYTGNAYWSQVMYIGLVFGDTMESHPQCSPRITGVEYDEYSPLSCGGNENCFIQTGRHLYITPSADDEYGFWLLIYDFSEKKFISPNCYNYLTRYSTFGSCLSHNNSHLFLTGGYEYNKTHDHLQIYGTETNEWTQGNTLNYARFKHGCSVTLDYKYLYVFGGSMSKSAGTWNYVSVRSIERYALQDDQWTLLLGETMMVFGPLSGANFDGYIAYLNVHDENIHVISKAPSASKLYVFCTNSERFCDSNSYGNIANGAIVSYHYSPWTTYLLNIQQSDTTGDYKANMKECTLGGSNSYDKPEDVVTYFETCDDDEKWTYECVESGQEKRVIVISVILMLISVLWS
eukprot:285878_1